MIPAYYEALKLAEDEKYSESLAKLYDAIESTDFKVESNPLSALILYRNIASMHMQLGEFDFVEKAF